MAEYTINNHLAASCNLIAEELEAHANSMAYTDEDGNLVILDSEDEPTDEMEYRGLYDFIESAHDIEIVSTISGEFSWAKLFFKTDDGQLVTVNTSTCLAEAKNGVESCSKWIDPDAIDELNEAIQELIETR